ncbi:Imidazoleglycerol-phosphate dehydratase [Caldithrix abyssi DSM 13497]|uniref:Histidine biosynthesis bifunctional protein HisB n=1 Tax=Caldithrix abyssi DSM 13497 TaxID=880073 RepID=H1XWS9_CALAY|nr:bifunctional histidinol-phosphatase/imidazoleglycerol-phosphate dehydratase HisB [Caldithrix abyssi]APF19128.1 imidazoleglycerol-phosphate dehydratase [Caldithrix abyssi DSM 13497]EHO43055.1 Imidazoleglycerol-phosphate dehydratase [Caldithrix abyssi DSM 13497]
MKRVLFIDRDGTIIKEPEDEQIDSFEKLDFLPNVISSLKKIARELDFELVMVTNQDGLGTQSFPEETFWPVHHLMLRVLASEGIEFKDILIDRTFPQDNAPTRKPGTAMLTHYMQGDYDLANSFVIGDRESDVRLAKNLGARAIFLSEESNPDADLCTTDWREVYRFLKLKRRVVAVERKTRETQIELRLNLDGNGMFALQSGIGFFDHMLELFAKNAGFDLSGTLQGDLHVDEHHLVEDTALVLGEAVRKGLGDMRGVQRYGFVLPMDESLARVAIDFCGRSTLVWKAKFRREKIGDMPTELFEHFFKSFAESAKCALHIKVKGENEHHKIEAVFKAFGRALKQAVKRDAERMEIPSTKGVL